MIRANPALYERHRREMLDSSTDSNEHAEYVKTARMRTPPAAALIEAAVSIIKARVGCSTVDAMNAYAKTASGREAYAAYLAEKRAAGGDCS